MKIRKPVARRLFAEGKQFWMTPCNMRKECGILINSVGNYYDGETFDTIYNAFCYYNCNSETGRYPAFYTDDEI